MSYFFNHKENHHKRRLCSFRKIVFHWILCRDSNQIQSYFMKITFNHDKKKTKLETQSPFSCPEPYHRWLMYSVCKGFQDAINESFLRLTKYLNHSRRYAFSKPAQLCLYISSMRSKRAIWNSELQNFSLYFPKLRWCTCCSVCCPNLFVNCLLFPVQGSKYLKSYHLLWLHAPLQLNLPTGICKRTQSLTKSTSAVT